MATVRLWESAVWRHVLFSRGRWRTCLGSHRQFAWQKETTVAWTGCVTNRIHDDACAYAWNPERQRKGGGESEIDESKRGIRSSDCPALLISGLTRYSNPSTETYREILGPYPPDEITRHDYLSVCLSLCDSMVFFRSFYLFSFCFLSFLFVFFFTSGFWRYFRLAIGEFWGWVLLGFGGFSYLLDKERLKVGLYRVYRQLITMSWGSIFCLWRHELDARSKSFREGFFNEDITEGIKWMWKP